MVEHILCSYKIFINFFFFLLTSFDISINMKHFSQLQCKQLYYCIKEAMEKGGVAGTAPELGGEFPVQDMSSGEGGLLQVCMEGVGLLFANSKVQTFYSNKFNNINELFRYIKNCIIY